MDASLEKNWDRSTDFLGGLSVQAAISEKGVCIDVGTSKRKKGKEAVSNGEDPMKSKKIKTLPDSEKDAVDPKIKVEVSEPEINQLENSPTTFKSPNHLNSPMPESSRRVNTPTLGSPKLLNAISRKSPTFRQPRRLFISPRELPKRLNEKAAGKSVSDLVEKSNISAREQKEQ
ncbi:7736_t:CDS:2, partial [Dentiscutata heterogama]